MYLCFTCNVCLEERKSELSIPHAGQVHRAKLRGQEVVIKVQRPGLKGLFDIDLKNLRVSVILGALCICNITVG